MMNLLFVIKSLGLRGGGAERVLADVTAGLVARGHRVRVLSFDSPDAIDFYRLHAAVERERVPCGRVDERSSFSHILQRAGRLRRTVKAAAPDAAIGFMHSAYAPLALGLAGTGIPVVASEHIVFDYYAGRPVEQGVVRLVPPFVSAYTGITDSMRDGYPASIRKKMVVVPNPVSMSSARRADVVGGPVKVLLTVGRLAEQKDHRTLIQAFARLARRFPDWRLRIVGDGELRADLEALVRELRISEQVCLPGATTDIESEYLGAQLFVFPSSYESFGIATAEALAHGLPAIGFDDCAGTNMLIAHGETGLLVGGDDRIAALAAGMAHLMGSAAERLRMAQAAPGRVSAFAPSRVVDAWESLLSSTVGGQPVARTNPSRQAD